MTPANVLPVEDGDVVFDMCAAPGGKSTELGAKLDRTGLLLMTSAIHEPRHCLKMSKYSESRTCAY